MNRLNPLHLLAVGALAATLAACQTTPAGPPTAADIMRDRAAQDQAQIEQMTELAEEWEEGARLVQEGEQRIRDGEQLIEAAEEDLQTGRERIEQGTTEVARGEQLMQESERRFRENYPEVDFPAEGFPRSEVQ